MSNASKQPGPILLVSGHPLNWHAGASSLFLHLEKALRTEGAEVTCLHSGDYQKSYAGALSKLTVPRQVQRRVLPISGDYAVIDVAGNIACSLFEKLTSRPRSQRPLLVNRLHGLEFKDEQASITEEIAGQLRLPWKYKNFSRHVINAREKRAIGAADIVVCSSSRDADAIVAAGWKKRECIEVMAPGVLPEFLTVERNYTRGDRLLWWGSWVERKGANYLAETFELALRDVPELKLTVGGAGKAPEVILREFSEAVRSRVRVLGFVSPETHRKELQSHDIFLFPSISEGFGLALVEAMASSMPAVTTFTGLAHDWLEHGENCLMVPMAAPSSTARAVVRLARSEELREKLGKNAQAVAQKLSWGDLARNSLSTYYKGLCCLREKRECFDFTLHNSGAAVRVDRNT